MWGSTTRRLLTYSLRQREGHPGEPPSRVTVPPNQEEVVEEVWAILKRSLLVGLRSNRMRNISLLGEPRADAGPSRDSRLASGHLEIPQEELESVTEDKIWTDLLTMALTRNSGRKRNEGRNDFHGWWKVLGEERDTESKLVAVKIAGMLPLRTPVEFDTFTIKEVPDCRKCAEPDSLHTYRRKHDSPRALSACELSGNMGKQNDGTRTEAKLGENILYHSYFISTAVRRTPSF